MRSVSPFGTMEGEVDVTGVPKAQAGAPQNSMLLKQYLFGIHTTGVSATTFGCLKTLRPKNVSKKLLEEVIQTDGHRNVLDELCQRHKRFNYHDYANRGCSEGGRRHSHGVVR